MSKYIILSKGPTNFTRIYGIAKDKYLDKDVYEWAYNYKDLKEHEFSEERAKEIIRDHNLAKDNALIFPAL